MSMATVGVDVSKMKFDAALLQDGKYRTKVFRNTAEGHRELVQWLRTHHATDALVCMEATGSYYEALAYAVAEQGIAVAVVNPAAVEAFGRAELSRSKTDRGDARLLARFAAAQRPSPWVPPPAEVRELRTLVRRLEDLQQLEQQELNRLETTAPGTTAASIQNVLQVVRAQIKAIKAAIAEHIDRHPDLRDKAKLLDSIPGIGAATIAMLLAELRFELFPCAKAISTYVGLSVREHTSGSSVRARARISKTGSSRVRRALYFPALVACAHNPVIRAFYQRLLARGKTKMQALCASMRKLLHIAYGVIKSAKPFDPSLHTC